MENKIVFTSDFLKVDDRQKDILQSPQEVNVNWIYELFSPLLESATDLSAYKYVADPYTRLKIYREADVEFSTTGWASFYHETLDRNIISNSTGHIFVDSIVVGFEMPPYLINYLESIHVTYIDLSIHPVRFLQDYRFGIRSNKPQIQEKIFSSAQDVRELELDVRVSKARSSRVYRNRNLVPNSAMFIGQIEVDSSLIYDGKVADLDSVEGHLLRLLDEHPHVYYKFHPHRQNKTDLNRMINSNSRASVIEVNIYDAFAADEISLFASLSSGSLHEACLFGKKTKRFIPKSADPFDFANYEYGPSYSLAPGGIFYLDYWKYLLGHSDFLNIERIHTQTPLKFSLNQQWGR